MTRARATRSDGSELDVEVGVDLDLDVGVDGAEDGEDEVALEVEEAADIDAAVGRGWLSRSVGKETVSRKPGRSGG